MKKITQYVKENEINLLVSVLFPFLVGFIVFVNHFAWNDPHDHKGALSSLQAVFSLLWVIPLPVAVLSFLGMFFYKRGEHLKDMALPTLFGSTLYFRLVTKGSNQNTVTQTANNIIETMETVQHAYGSKIPYVMEVVAEITTPPLHAKLAASKWGDKIILIEPPVSYKTSKNALYKARALHFALDYSQAKDDDWIFHLDDESQIDNTTVLGILEFLSKEEQKLSEDAAYKPRIGQGTILYHRNIHQNLLYTLADSIRTADDMGRYFLQYMFGVCIFGMHGSYILCRNSVEKKEGFDFQPQHCITEDAYWGLRLMQKGYTFGHVYGFVHEQSPAKATDFIKQRRRWFVGITHVLQAKDIALRFKFMLLMMTFLWAFSGLIILYTAFNIIHPAPIPEMVGLLASFSYTIYLLMYVIGFYVNMQYSQIPLSKKAFYLCAQVLFIPVFAMLEASGALYGLLYRKLDFYVIKK